MDQIKRQVPALVTLAISAVLTCIPIGKGALGVEVAARQTATVTVTNVRVGKHADKTRIVLDVSRPTDLRYGVSADGTAVFIDLPSVEWNASPFEPRHSKGKVLEFRYSPASHGGRFNILTDGPVSIKKPFFVRPGGKHGHRIVIDLIPSQLRKKFVSNSFRPRRGLLNTTFSPSRPIGGAEKMVAGLANVGVTDQEPPAVEAVIPVRPNVLARNTDRTFVSMNNDAKVEVAHDPVPKPYENPNTGIQHGGTLGLKNVYFKGVAGVSVIPEIENNGAGNKNTMEFDPGFNFIGGLGIDLDNGFRAEAEIQYTLNSLSQVKGTGNGRVLGATTFTAGDLSTLAIMGNVAYDFDNLWQFTPYVSAGAGLAGVFLNEVKADGTTIADSNEWVFAMQFGAGVSMPIDDITTLEAGYRYFESQDPEFGDQRGIPFTTQLASHNFMVGARLNF